MPVNLHFAAASLCLLVAGCASVGGGGKEAGRAIGWLHGACIGLAEAGVRTGAPVAVAVLDGSGAVVTTAIAGPARSPDTCYPLMDDRREANLASGLRFYRLDLPQPVELGIGVVQRGGDRVLPVAQLLDTNGDGRRDAFTRCATSEGVRFSVWPGPPRVGDPLWRGHYYLGYDTQADCPSP